MSVLDAEAAAMFSTAAALEIRHSAEQKGAKKPSVTNVSRTSGHVSASLEPSSTSKPGIDVLERRVDETNGTVEEAEAVPKTFQEEPDTSKAVAGLDWASIKSATAHAPHMKSNVISGLQDIDAAEIEDDDEHGAEEMAPAVVEEDRGVVECDEHLRKLFLPCLEPNAQGKNVWEGSLSVPAIGTCAMSASSLAGSGDIKELLGKETTTTSTFKGV